MRGRVTELARVSHARYSLALAVVLGRDLAALGSVAGGTVQPGSEGSAVWSSGSGPVPGPSGSGLRACAQACAGA